MEELKQLQKLIDIERKADLALYEKEVVMQPLGERRKKGLTWYPLILQQSGIGMGEKFYVIVERKTYQGESHAFQPGSMVSLFNHVGEGKKSQRLPGIATAVWKNSMKITFNAEELPDWIEYGNPGVNMLFDDLSYKEMDIALSRVQDAKEGRLKDLRDILLGKSLAAFNEDLPALTDFGMLNHSQQAAVQKIISAKDVAIIHGPPGTGKTTTLVQAVKLSLENEKQVLVTAPSNTAVDLLTEKLLKKGLKVLRIGNPARVSEELMQHSLETQITVHTDYPFLKKLRKKGEELRKMAFKYKRNFGRAEREQRKLLMKEAHKVLDEATYLEKYIVDRLLEEAQVITATLVGTVNKFIRYRQFSTVFIDEAAQSLEPASWIPITKSDRVIFAGDHFQLPPTVKSYEAMQAGLSTTLFEKVIKRQKVDVMLNVQYRMHKQIMQFSNQMFYKGELQAHESVKNHLLANTTDDYLLAKPIEFIDTAGCSFEEKQNPETLSKFNPDEAGLILKHLAKLFEHIYATHKYLLNDTFSVGIISPYKAQVQYIKDLLKEDAEVNAFDEFIKINSVDGFQGQEKEVIYISLVRSNDKGKIGFLEDTRRMNVALTRARKKLIIIGDSATLGQHPFYQQFLKIMEQLGAYSSAWEWMN
ncbi:MAG: AAA domain-containing protein [Bacteroidota bacterium]